MKKETLIKIVLATIGGMTFSLGMCMSLVEEWNLFIPGIITTGIGILILLIIIPIHRKTHPKKNHKKIDKKKLVPWIVGSIAILLMGFGMSRLLVEKPSQTDAIIGLITGIIGLTICILNYPVYAYFKSNRGDSNE